MKLSKTKLTRIVAATLAALALSGPAWSGDEGEKPESDMGEKPAFEGLDVNLDGSISKTEAEDTWLAAEFQTVDSDGNGLVNRTEYENALS